MDGQEKMIEKPGKQQWHKGQRCNLAAVSEERENNQ
jgi:hypothetical protein